MLANQIHGQLDLIFPGLTGCFTHGSGRSVVAGADPRSADPYRVRRLGVDGVLRFVRRRGVRMNRSKAEQVVAAAQVALRLPATERQCDFLDCASGASAFGAALRARNGQVLSARPALRCRPGRRPPTRPAQSDHCEQWLSRPSSRRAHGFAAHQRCGLALDTINESLTPRLCNHDGGRPRRAAHRGCIDSFEGIEVRREVAARRVAALLRHRVGGDERDEVGNVVPARPAQCDRCGGQRQGREGVAREIACQRATFWGTVMVGPLLGPCADDLTPAPRGTIDS